ncbi:aldo/keto reductase [Candidatus Saccharibacteria bacterium]|nr:aldo/keto reductase [Candidatus Saccharibacteria bacterium]
MKIPVKTLKNGFSLPIYGMGLWQVGGRYEIDTSQDTEEIENIQRAITLGIAHFDTAELYAAGHSEELLGAAIKGFDRNKLTIATKVSPEHHHYDALLHAFENSLKRIGTEYIDLYMLHRFPPPGTKIEESLKAMNRLVEEGVVKNIGVSNFTNNRFKEAQKYSAHPIACNQVHYNVEYREVEDKSVLRFCQENDTFLVAYRPLQKGELPKSPLLKELAEKYNKTPTQVSLNWLISQDNVVTICKTSNPEHLKENLGALGWKLEAGDVERVRRNYEVQHKVSDAVPLDYEGDIVP